MKFSKENVVTTLVIEGDYFAQIKQLKDQLALDMFQSVDFAMELVGADYLFISGNGVKDDIYNDLLSHGGLEGTTKLCISKSPISSSGLDKLVPLENIEQLLIESDTIDIEALKLFKSRRPNCLVELNRKEVLV